MRLRQPWPSGSPLKCCKRGAASAITSWWRKIRHIFKRIAKAADQIKRLVSQIETLEPAELAVVEDILKSLQLYQQQFAAAVALLQKSGGRTGQRVQQAVADAYEADLNELLRRSRRTGDAELLQELQSQVQSFECDSCHKMLGQENPTLRLVTPQMQASSQQVFQLASRLEAESWERVQRDHDEARTLLHDAEWILSIVSVITLLLSLWISFVLPRAVVKPLVDLRNAVDQAAAGNDQSSSIWGER